MKKILLLVLITLLVPILASAANESIQTLPVIGAVETLTLVKEKLRIPARIDTGAETSSLGAEVYSLLSVMEKVGYVSR
jgi:hypothetical protein